MINARARAAIDKPAKVKLPAMCTTHSRAVGIGGDATVGTLQQRKAGDARAFRASGEFDALTMDLAHWLLLGRGGSVRARRPMCWRSACRRPTISATLSAQQGQKPARRSLALDATLGRMFAVLDKSKVPYVVVLTADHGGHDLPERNMLFRGCPPPNARTSS
jgi:hypothetical protein